MENKDELLKIWEGVDYVLSTQQGTRAEHEKLKTDFLKLKDYILTSEKIKI